MSRGGEEYSAETFRPRLAPVMAAVWYVIAALAGYDLVRRGDGRAIAIGVAALALVTVIVYGIAQRPAVVADARGLLLRNVVRDVWLPWHLVTGISTRWSLTIETAERSFESWALSRRGVVRERRQQTTGSGSLLSPRPAPAHDIVWTIPDRLEQLRRRGLHGERKGEVEVRTVWPVVAGLVLSAGVLAAVLAVPGLR